MESVEYIFFLYSHCCFHLESDLLKSKMIFFPQMFSYTLSTQLCFNFTFWCKPSVAQLVRFLVVESAHPDSSNLRFGMCAYIFFRFQDLLWCYAFSGRWRSVDSEVSMMTLSISKSNRPGLLMAFIEVEFACMCFCRDECACIVSVLICTSI